MEIYLTQAEQLYKDERYEEALAVIEEAIRLGGSPPDPRLYSVKANVLEHLAQQAYEIAKQRGYTEHKQKEASDEVETSPDNMSLLALEGHCMSEIQHYRHHEPYDEQYCLEFFHRAMVKHDLQAWELLQRRFTPMVRTWMRNYPQRDAACRYQSEEDYVADTFVRVWQASLRNRLEFNSLAAALSYLKISLQGAVIDKLRAYSRLKEAPLPEPHDTEEPATEDDYESLEWWRIIRSLLPNERERKLAYLLYRCGLKPREIVRYSSDEFSDEREVYQLSRNIVERLMRNRDQIRWRLSTGGQ